MKILVIGSGGREHALVWKLAQSPLAEKIYAAPGNPGMAQHAECVDIKAGDIPALLAFAKEKGIGLTVVGPEDPLVNGIADVFEAEGLTVAGPSQYAAQLEGSKAFTKDFMAKYNVPTAAYRVFSDAATAKTYVRQADRPLVVKADGLAAGKGVLLCKDADEAEAGGGRRHGGKSASARPATGWWWKSGSRARKPAFWSSATAKPWCPCPPARTTRRWARATPG